MSGSTLRLARLTALAWLALALFVSPAGAQSGAPELPRSYVDTTSVAPTGLVHSVAAGGNLQAALDAALPGDVIKLQAGATFMGPFTLPDKPGTGWIVVRTSAPDSSMPPPGTRIGPSYAPALPKIVSASSAPALQTAPGAHHFRFIGVEFTVTPQVTLNYNLVALGDPTSAQNSLVEVPHHLILDRVYIHGNANVNLRRGVGLNSAWTAVIDSYISDVHEIGADSQAIGGWNGPGPFKIANNYLEGAGENVLFGGADPSIFDLVPSDIEVRGNHFFKPLSWRIGDPSYAGKPWSVKNIFELKNARRVLVEGNVFENNWLHAQNGFAILFTVRNQSGSAPWCVVEDVTFRLNILRHTASAVNVLGVDNNYPSQVTKRILVKDNLFEDINGPKWGGHGRLYQILSGATDITIDHNTGFHTGEVIMADGAANPGFVYRNNLSANNQYGVAGSGTFGNPLATLSVFFPGALFSKNVLMGGNALDYPAGNFFPASWAEVQFVNLTGGNYRLAATSPYKGAGTDGKDVGANIDAVQAATAGAVQGSGPDQTPPVISGVASSSVSFSGAVVTWTTNEASDSLVEYGPTTSYGSASALDPALVTSHSRTLGGLQSSTLYHYRVRSRDAAGNQAVSGDFTFTTQAAPDTTPPAVSITAPAAGSSLSGVVTVAATASDNVGVAGVRFLVDGAGLGAEDLTAPYSIQWDTRTVANGSRTLTAVARDRSGNTASASRAVTVANGVAQSPYHGQPFVPGLIQAEDFDRGGEGVAYHDQVAGNAGGLYRPAEDVDIVSPYAGGYAVNNFQTGEWLEYTISVSQPGLYRLEALASSAFTGSRWHMEIDGVNVTGPVTAPNTGGWSAFQWVGKSGVSVGAGLHVLRIHAEAQYFNLDALRFVLEQSPYSGQPIAVPGLIPAENFDRGGEGVAYHDQVAGNAGGLYRPAEDVDIVAPYAGGYVVNNFETGEWLEYTISVSQPGLYRLEALASSAFVGSRWHMEIDGVNVTGPVTAPNTGNWSAFQWVGKGGVSLTAGLHVLRIHAEAQYFNLDAVRIVQ